MDVDVDPAAVNLIAIWVETLVYGIYTSLFFESMFIVARRQRKRPASAWIFTVVTLVMYLIATLHVAVGLLRLIKGYVLISDRRAIGEYFRSTAKEHIAYSVLHSAMSWTGQSLLIYRCYLIWDKFLVVLPSLLILCATAATSILINVVESTQDDIQRYRRVADVVFVLAFCQNILTTGLVVFRLVLQHRKSKSVGVQDERVNLHDVGIIVLESTGIYTLALTIAMFLHSVNSNAKFIVLSASVPIWGIAFTLVVVRLNHSIKYSHAYA